MDVGSMLGLLVGAAFGLASLTIALVFRDRADARHYEERREMLSRIQHPDLVSHRAALDYRAEGYDAEIHADDLAMLQAGRVFNEDQGDDDAEAAAPVPDARVR